MTVGDLVWWDGFFHKKLDVSNSLNPTPPLSPQDYALPGIIVQQVSHHQFEVMVGDRLILADGDMLLPMYRNNEVI